MSERKPLGTPVWFDLTIPDATTVRDFYAAVVGWTHQPISMGDYDDYAMLNAAGEGAAGVCHARGENASQPAQWIMYVTVPDLDASLAACRATGGEAVTPVREMGGARFVVIRDPAGASIALYQEAPATE